MAALQHVVYTANYYLTTLYFRSLLLVVDVHDMSVHKQVKFAQLKMLLLIKLVAICYCCFETNKLKY